ncbi:hypothetical protein OfM1_20720 [Lactovum odontotermitis]
MGTSLWAFGLYAPFVTEAENSTADLFCMKCNGVKTFSALKDRDLNSNYAPYDLENVKVLGDTLVVRMTCPTCGEKVYMSYFLGEGNKSDRHPYDLVKYGEYPDQTKSRLLYIEKYLEEFPKEAELLEKAEKAYSQNLGVGSVVYLRKAYETLLVDTLTRENIQDIPGSFKGKLDKANEVSDIIPPELKENDYGLFGEMSDITHVAKSDQEGVDNFNSLKTVFCMILDNILEKKRKQDIIAGLKPNKH